MFKEQYLLFFPLEVTKQQQGVTVQERGIMGAVVFSKNRENMDIDRHLL